MFKPLVGLLKKLVPSLVAALPFLTLLIVILINLAIWLTGPWLIINEEAPLASISARLLTMVIFSLACLAAWGLFQWRKLNAYHAELQREEALREDPVKAAEENQETELNKVMTNMQESLNKRNYLYALPWYLVMGLENAGKTSLINRSGQDFTFSSILKSSGEGSKNAYSFDWWVGDSSVLIDPDGELLTQGKNVSDPTSDGVMEKRLWEHFIHWLERTRSRRPLNGIVLALDVSKLATSTIYERKAFATILRSRIRELMETLSTRLPVYVTLTKLDLLYGFEPFFKNYTKEQREEVLGFTFSLSSVDDHDNWMKEFDEEYEEFISRVNAILPHIVAKNMSDEDRNAVYSFTRQISGLKDILSVFFQDALSSDQFSTSALVRGVYFTSVYQQGVPTNAFDDASSRRYGLTHAINSAQNAKNSTMFFTKNLFNNIIYPEAGLASDNFRVSKQKKRIILLSTVSCSIISLILIGSWHRYYLKNIEQADAVLSKVNLYMEEYPTDMDLLSQNDILPPLNTIRDATLEFGFFRDKPRYISDLGLYQGHAIGPQVEMTYLNLLEYRYLPSLMMELVADLKKAETDENKLSILRVYRMLVDKNGRYDEFVLNYFSRKWQVKYSGNKAIQDKLLQHLEYALQHTDLYGARLAGDQNADKVLRPYDKLIATTQDGLSSLAIDERVYRNLKLSAQTALGADLNIRTLVGPSFNLVFDEREIGSDKLNVPKVLSKEGFKSYFLPQSESVSDLALIDSWVLGQNDNAQFSKADKQALKERIRDSYVSDYTNTWRNVLNEIDIKNFSNISEAVDVLDNLTGNGKPLQRLLTTLRDNTKLYPELPEAGEAREEMLKSASYNLSSRLNAPFAELNRIVESNDGQPAYIDELLLSIEQLRTYLAAIQDAPDMGRAALETTKSRASLNSVDPIYTLSRVATGLPKPLDSMMSKLADESWYVIKQEAIRYLEVRWHDDIYKVYEQKFAGRYPFDPSSSRDVSLQDFEEFFAPGGTLDRFYNDQLKMFIDENSNISGGHQGKSLIRDDVLKQLGKAKLIQEAFFNRKGILDVSFGVEPILLSANKRRGVLNIDGQYLSYSHGPRNNVEVIWPNTLRDNTTSKLTLVPVEANESPRSISTEGPWSLYRLLDTAKVVGASDSSVTYQFTVDNGDMEVKVNATTSNPFTQRLFKNFELSNTLY